MTTAKGGAIANTDKVYVQTATTKGILGIQNGEVMIAKLMCGWSIVVPSTEGNSRGEVKIYAGGRLECPNGSGSDFCKFNPGYGELTTSGTTSLGASGTRANFDINEMDEIAELKASFDVDYLYIFDIKSGQSVTLEDHTGEIYHSEIKGASDAAYNLIGVPGNGAFIRGIKLNKANAGLFTSSAYANIDLHGEGSIVRIEPSRGSQFAVLPVPGRQVNRLFRGSVVPGSFNITYRVTSGYEDAMIQELEIMQARGLQFLAVLCIDKTYPYPNDYLFRGRIRNPLQVYKAGIDYRDLMITVTEDP